MLCLYLQSNPEEEEDQRQLEESEYDSDDGLDEEEQEAMNQLQIRDPVADETNDILARIRRHQEIQERKHIERELLAQKDMLIKRECDLPPSAGYGPSGSVSSPNSPPGQQYLYAATPTMPGFVSPSLAAVQAVASGVLSSHPSGSHPASFPIGSSPAGSSGPTNNGGSPSSHRGQDSDQSKYTFEEQFKQVRHKVIRNRITFFFSSRL